MFAQTKFRPPPRREQHVARERLLDRTAGPFAGSHLVICAPAGAGKSTFAAQWAADLPHAAWVSLSEEDNEPGRFWAAIIAAFGTAHAGLGVSEIGALVSGADVNEVLLRLLVEVAQTGEDLALVIDDLHLIDDPECLNGLHLVLNHAPPNLRLALCTRTTPLIALERLIANGVVMVVEGSDLRLDEAEIQEFLNGRLALDLPPRDLEVVHRRTEGWAAGVYLAALAARSGGAIAAAADRRTRGYLTAEVLEAADPERLAFLESVSVLDRFCADLCDHVLERTDSAELIETLERRNLFVIALDESGTWYRLHHLFAELLRERLAQRDDPRRLHARAAGWYVKQGEIPDAIEALLRAERFKAAGELVAAHEILSINRSRLGAELQRWLDKLPETLVRRTPALCLSRAWVAGVNGRVGEMSAWLDRARETPSTGPLPNGATAEAEAELMRGCFAFANHGVVLEHVRRAAELDSPASGWWALIQFVRGIAEYLDDDGDTDAALAALEEAREAAHLPEHHVVAACAPGLEAAIHAERGERTAARMAIARAEAMRAGLEHVPHAAISWWTTSRAHLLLGDVDDAARDAEAAVKATHDIPAEHDPTMLGAPSLMSLARARLAQGRRDEARQLLTDARARLQQSNDPGRYRTWLDEAFADLQPKLTDVDGVEELSDRELEVLRRFAGPETLADIAGELFVSQNTLKSHAKSIYRKLNVAGRAQAVERGRDLGLLV